MIVTGANAIIQLQHMDDVRLYYCDKESYFLFLISRMEHSCGKILITMTLDILLRKEKIEKMKMKF